MVRHGWLRCRAGIEYVFDIEANGRLVVAVNERSAAELVRKWRPNDCDERQVNFALYSVNYCRTAHAIDACTLLAAKRPSAVDHEDPADGQQLNCATAVHHGG